MGRHGHHHGGGFGHHHHHHGGFGHHHHHHHASPALLLGTMAVGGAVGYAAASSSSNNRNNQYYYQQQPRPTTVVVHTTAPAYQQPPPYYGAPPPVYGAPPPQYCAPPPQYGAPPPQYGPPQPVYGQQQPGHVCSSQPSYPAQPAHSTTNVYNFNSTPSAPPEQYRSASTGAYQSSSPAPYTQPAANNGYPVPPSSGDCNGYPAGARSTQSTTTTTTTSYTAAGYPAYNPQYQPSPEQQRSEGGSHARVSPLPSAFAHGNMIVLRHIDSGKCLRVVNMGDRSDATLGDESVDAHFIVERIDDGRLMLRSARLNHLYLRVANPQKLDVGPMVEHLSQFYVVEHSNAQIYTLESAAFPTSFVGFQANGLPLEPGKVSMYTNEGKFTVTVVARPQ